MKTEKMKREEESGGVLVSVPRASCIGDVFVQRQIRQRTSSRATGELRREGDEEEEKEKLDSGLSGECEEDSRLYRGK